MARSSCKMVEIDHCHLSFVVTHDCKDITLGARSGNLNECRNDHSAYDNTRFSVVLIPTELVKNVFTHGQLRDPNGGIWETCAWYRP